MRLLERKPDGNLVFRESTDTDVPVYAILSHTWLANSNEEVSFQNVEAGTGKSKAGWRKIQFCADKAAADGLRYFWIDTCCIDKNNSTELSKAISSMFRWYQKAARCYVYLTDVSTHDGKETPQKCLFHWEPTFRKSRWFTRGWTPQELLAPTLVDLEGNLDQVVTAVKTWLDLQRNTRWLMIYGNYDNPRTPGNLDRSAVDICAFLPQADHGSIIITTRSAQVNQGHRIHIQKLANIREGLEILSKTSKRGNIENGRLF